MPPAASWQLQYPWDSGFFLSCVYMHVSVQVGTCVGWISLGQCEHACTYLCFLYLCVCVILIATHMNMQISFKERMCSALKPTLHCWPNFTLQCICVCMHLLINAFCRAWKNHSVKTQACELFCVRESCSASVYGGKKKNTHTRDKSHPTHTSTGGCE